jgi:hypothetical protein
VIKTRKKEERSPERANLLLCESERVQYRLSCVYRVIANGIGMCKNFGEYQKKEERSPERADLLLCESERDLMYSCVYRVIADGIVSSQK